MLLYIGVIITTFTLLGLGYFLLAQSKKSATIQTFGVFVLALAFWVSANFIGANFKDQPVSLYSIYADFMLGPWVAYAFWRFARTLLYAVKKPPSPIIQETLIVAAATASLLPLTGLMVNVSTNNGMVSITYEHLYWLYGLGMVFIAVAGIAAIVRTGTYADILLRRQLKVINVGLIVTVVSIFFANLLVPQITDSKAANLLAGNVAYLGIIFFVAITSYAIVKHRLFDIRLVVARSIGYTVLLSTLTIMYIALIIAFSLIFASERLVVSPQQLLYIIPAIIAALVYAPLKRTFDRLTNKFFYQDAYDPRSLFDDYNKALVSTIDLDVLLERVSKVIAEYLKVEYCVVAVRSKDEFQILGTKGKSRARIDSEVIGEIMDNLQQSVVVVDNLPQQYNDLRTALERKDVALLIELSADYRRSREELGYMILGNKKSGNLFNDQDVRIVETLANELIIALQNALRFEEIERFNETLQKRVDDATRQLRESNKKLKQLNDSKDDFIGMASHQLRTPLTAIKGYVSLVMDGDAGKVTVTQKKLLQQAFSSSQKMVYLVADLLNVSRLKTGKFVIERTSTNLVKLIKDEMDQLQTEAATRGVGLEFDMPADFPSLPFDETKTRQVIMNFLDNAIYYTPAGGHVRAELVELPNSIEFRVIDDGIGVPKTDQYHMFTKFYRAKNAQRARPDGTGLGLYMAQKVIVAQGGAVIFKSEEGKGSTFGFSFPKDMPTESVAIPAQTRD